MPSLDRDTVSFDFPHLTGASSLEIELMRTLRIPDSDNTYPLPPGLGRFPIRHVEDILKGLPAGTCKRGGVVVPMWQAEAMWLNFSNRGWDRPTCPVAIKIAAGKINAVTGEAWTNGLNRDPQDYMVSPDQPWLDGFAIQPGVIRQFVAMPLGEGYSVEEQLTSEAESGGLQISVTPVKPEIWADIKVEWERRRSRIRRSSRSMEDAPMYACYSASEPMGLAAGGRMHQVIYPDRRDARDWDLAATQRLFVTLINAKDWKGLTGENVPTLPPSARDYSRAGLPWFEFYGADQDVPPGGKGLEGIKSVGELHKEKTGFPLTESGDVDIEKLLMLTEKPRKIFEGSGRWSE